MFSKNDIIFYVVAGNVIALIAGLAGANLPDSIDNIDTKLLREYVIYLLKRINLQPVTTTGIK